MIGANWVGTSEASREILEYARRLRGQPHVNVLILGESGTGKEILARLIAGGEMDTRPFVTVNMPGIPASLLELELFGCERGAFTDAKQARAGKFRRAHGGDIFLDEIAEIPPELQCKLLRTIQEKTVERLGGAHPERCEFRVIAATNRRLGPLIRAGRFREDLFYRLADVILTVPPLRERPDDIPALVEHFVTKYLPAGAARPEVTAAAHADLRAYPWPGNVRQLESTVKRALVFRRGDKISHFEIYDLDELTLEDLPELRVGDAGGLDPCRRDYERRVIRSTIDALHGDKRAAMKKLKLSKSTFYRKLKGAEEKSW